MSPRPPGVRPTEPGPGPELPPLRLTRRGLVRCAQLAATAGALGVAAVSCGVRIEGATQAAAADRVVPAGARSGALPSPGGPPAGGEVAGTGSGPAAAGTSPSPAGAVPSAAGTPPAATAPAAALAGVVPAGVGARWAASLADHDQVVVVTGPSAAATRNVVRWYDRVGGSWIARGGVRGWNGAGGWTSRHTVGDGRTPVGVFGLTDAGGYDPNPGTALPYEFSRSQYAEIVNGVRTFAHVLAINYNRVPGTAPSDSVRPEGWSVGGSIWVHVEHGSPTQACVGVPDAALVALLRWLRPAAGPVILMGPAAVLAA